MVIIFFHKDTSEGFNAILIFLRNKFPVFENFMWKLSILLKLVPYF